MTTEQTKTEKTEKTLNILEFSHTEARHFFLKHENYCNFDLPPYFSFSSLLNKLDQELKGKNLSDFYNSSKPFNCEGINHIILNNKDGRYAWRPLQIIHPALYVSLVHKITQDENWKKITNRFKSFSEAPRIRCISLPVKSLTSKKDRAEQILYWWQEIEQSSIEFALDYEYIIHTDISNCYDSIYTHSIAWALHDKPEAKKNINNKKLLGNKIDKIIRDMSYNQTNGIPQGSVLMDFIAEMVLGYADLNLAEKIHEDNFISDEDYYILRYRDDYRIFINNPQIGDRIVKKLTEVLSDLGLRLNPEKTNISNEVIKSSIKDDKLFWINQKHRESNLQKHLLIIHTLAQKYPNSGSLIRALNDYYKKIVNLSKYNKSDLYPLISIIVDIAVRNPRCFSISAAILSKFVNLLSSKMEKTNIFDRIKKRFASIPNTQYLELWLQRITVTFEPQYSFEGSLCRLVAGESQEIWNSEWLANNKCKQIISDTEIISQAKIDELDPVVPEDEVNLFMQNFQES